MFAEHASRRISKLPVYLNGTYVGSIHTVSTIRSFVLSSTSGSGPTYYLETGVAHHYDFLKLRQM
jgi:hypothetical protein